MEHIEGDILLTMPKISELDDPAITDDMLVKNKDIVEQMEEVIMSWEKHIHKANNLVSLSYFSFIYFLSNLSTVLDYISISMYRDN